MGTLTATTAAEQLLADVRQTLARHDGAESLDELRELADELSTALRRVRGRISRLAKRDEPAEPGQSAVAEQPPTEPPAAETQSVPKPTQSANPANLTGGTTAVTQPLPHHPQYPPPRPYRPPPPSNGIGTAGFVLGLLGLLFAFVPLIGVIAWPLVILGFVLSATGVNRGQQYGAPTGLAVAGMICSGAGLLVCILWLGALA